MTRSRGTLTLLPVVRLLLILAVSYLVVMAVWYGLVAPWLRRGPHSDVALGICWQCTRLYAAVRHHLTVHGREHLPANDADHDGLIVVANHTSAVDPFMLQAPSRFWIRWMMAEDMMIPSLDWAWRLQQVIPVDRTRGDSSALRAAIRHVRAGGCVGVFPEGRLVQPPGEVRPFLPGVGALVSRARKPVLLAWITGTPESRGLSEAMLSTSRTQVTFIGRYEFDRGATSESIAEHLRSEIARVSGWPLNDEMLPLGEPPAGRTGAPVHSAP